MYPWRSWHNIVTMLDFVQLATLKQKHVLNLQRFMITSPSPKNVLNLTTGKSCSSNLTCIGFNKFHTGISWWAVWTNIQMENTDFFPHSHAGRLLNVTTKITCFCVKCSPGQKYYTNVALAEVFNYWQTFEHRFVNSFFFSLVEIKF